MHIPSALTAISLCLPVVFSKSMFPGLIIDSVSTAGPPLPPISSSSASPSSGWASHTTSAPIYAETFTASRSSSSVVTNSSAFAFTNRAAIPACLKTVELSCLNLAANCIDSVGMQTSLINKLWSVSSCVAAATCYSVGDLITSVECQTGLATTNDAQAFLDYTNIYSTIVGSCALAPGGCPITQQNYIDFYYGQLTAIHSADFPSSSDIVVALWAEISGWAATGPTVPYLNFNDWLHYSSWPSTTTSVPASIPTYTQIDWNPNPAPPAGAASETFVTGTSTLIIPVPTTTTTVVVASATLTLAPGGTPINGPVPSGISQPGAVTPTWNPNVIPPTSASSITFTAPPSFTTVVPVPTSSDSSPQNITGPAGDKNSNGDEWWLLLFGGIIGGLLPRDVGIPGGTTPAAAPPAEWTGSWSNPDPSGVVLPPGGGGNGNDDPPTDPTSASQSPSSSSSASCAIATPGYSLPDDSENADWQGSGTDPDRRRVTGRRSVRSKLERRADPRSIAVNICGIKVVNTNAVGLGAGTYYSIGTKLPIGVGTTLTATQVNSRPVGNGPNTVAQEHIFELGYINQFFKIATDAGVSCTWIQNNVFNFVRKDGSNMGVSLLNAIDTVQNMAWVDKPMNQAKSNVVNQNKASPNNPPQSNSIDAITSFTLNQDAIQDVEYFARNFAALGTYFGSTGATFRATALRVQNLLAEITPDSPDADLPGEFNGWLRDLISTYPNGCTSRANNVYDYYVNKMNNIATQANPVPACFPLYSAGLNAQSFAFANLIPAPSTLPICDIPGTRGKISIGPNAHGNPVYLLGDYRIMGSGNTQFYALGDGVSLAGSHFIANDLSGASTSCGGVYQIALGVGAAGGAPDAHIALNCNAQGGNKVEAPFHFVFNNQQLECVIFNFNDGTNVFYTICAPGMAAATACGNAMVQGLAGTYPQAYLSTPSFRFKPT